MNLRRVLLRIMLASLAIAAVVGALSVLVLSAETSWRIFGTGILTAVICAILLLASRLTDKPQTRAAGLLGMALLLIEYLLCLFLIWGSAADWGESVVERIGLAALFLPATGVPAVALLRFAGTALGKWAGRIGVALSAIEFIILMIPFGLNFLSPSNDPWYATSGTCAIFFPLLIMSLAGLNAAPGAWRRWPAIIAAAGCLLISLFGIWNNATDHPGAFSLLVGIPLVLAYWNVAMLVPLRSGQRWARWIAILSLAATTACIDSGVILNDGGNGDLFARLSAAFGIVAGCSTLALAILAALNRKIERPAIALDDVRSMEVICPLCRKRQTIATGGAACVECGLRISIQLEMPQCAKCGYLLRGLKSDRCPECGTVVREHVHEQPPISSPAIPVKPASMLAR